MSTTKKQQLLTAVSAHKAGRSAWIDEELLRVRALPNNLPTPDHAFWDEWLDHKVYELAKREMHLA